MSTRRARFRVGRARSFLRDVAAVGCVLLSARSLMIDQVAYRLLENAGGAP